MHKKLPILLAEKGYLTFDTKPLGSIEKPLILRTFVPTTGVSKQRVLVNHSKGTNSPKYGASSGKESKNEYLPIDGIPAAIAVNLERPYLMFGIRRNADYSMHGLTDSLICKITGVNESLAAEKGFGYVPKLYGFVFYKAQGVHPLRINEQSIAEIGSPKYVGYSLGKDCLPSCDFKSGKHSISVKVSPGPSPQILRLDFTSTSNENLDFKSPNTQVKQIERNPEV